MQKLTLEQCLAVAFCALIVAAFAGHWYMTY